MAKKTRLLLTVIVLMLFVFSAYASSVPNVQASEVTAQQKGLAISKDVIGIDTARYTVNAKEYSQASYRGVLPREDVRCELNSEGSNIDVCYTFVNGKLYRLNVLENEGTPRLTKTINGVTEKAKDFLSSYQSYFRNSLYGDLKSTLVGVDSSKNLTKTVGNMKLEVSNRREEVIFRWIYTFNGIEAPDKGVALRYENGLLKSFYDSWDLYKIGSTDVNVSEEEAISSGLVRAKSYSWPNDANSTWKVKNFNVTGAMIWETVFRSSLVADKARNEDLLMLYPMRHVWVSLDKFYPPGNVYGFNVYIWADTGEVCHIQERISTVDPPADMIASISDVTDLSLDASGSVVDSASSLNAVFAIVPCGAVGLVALVWLRRKRRLSMRRFVKFGGFLLCVLTLSMLSVPIATVGAVDDAKERAMIWGSESSGAVFDGGPEWSWRKHPDEVDKQDDISEFLETKFGNHDYTADDYQGDDGSDKDDILLRTAEANAVYHQVAVVDFDHGNGAKNIPINDVPSNEFHYLFEDQFGTLSGHWPDPPEYAPTSTLQKAVFDFEVYPRTADDKVFFAFINTCNSAHIGDTFGGSPSTQGIVPYSARARGMPFAWSHRKPGIDMSADGYNSPDGDGFCFIGFLGGSAPLKESVAGSDEIHEIWVEQFFYHALDLDESVNQALDSASEDCLGAGKTFADTDLYTGFEAVWPMYYGDPPSWHYGEAETGDGWMKVYGDGNVHLKRKGGHWNFDEITGLIATDDAHGNNGVLTEQGWWYPKIGERSLRFDGSSSYMTVDHDSTLNFGTGSFSFSAWIRWEGLKDGSYDRLVVKSNYPSQWWCIDIAPDGAVEFESNIGTITWGGGPLLETGKWVHLAIVVDRGNNQYRLYKNAALHNVTDINWGGSPDSTADMIFAPGSDFKGAIDELRICDYALSPSQIVDQSAAASYHFNAEDMVYDSSPNENHGTTYGVATSVTGLVTSNTYSYGLQFGGYNDYMVVNHDPGLNLGSGDFTISAWIKWFGFRDGDYDRLIQKTNYPTSWWCIDIASNGAVEFESNLGATSWTGASVLEKDQWVHLAIVVDRTNNQLRIYRNGVRRHQETVSWSGTPDSTADMIFAPGYDFRGIIDDFKICTYAVSQSELSSYYNANRPYHYLTVTTGDPFLDYWLPISMIKIDGEYGKFKPYLMNTNYHTVEVPPYFEFYYNGYPGWMIFDHYEIYGSTVTANPVTIPFAKDTVVKACYVPWQ